MQLKDIYWASSRPRYIQFQWCSTFGGPRPHAEALNIRGPLPFNKNVVSI